MVILLSVETVFTILYSDLCTARTARSSVIAKKKKVEDLSQIFLRIDPKEKIFGKFFVEFRCWLRNVLNHSYQQFLKNKYMFNQRKRTSN